MNDSSELIHDQLDSIILLMSNQHDLLFLRKFMHEHGFVRYQELESTELGDRYRLYRK